MPSEQKITIRTIAKEFGVAESTVSRAFQPHSRISDAVRSQILEYAEKHNYVPNKAAARLPMRELNIGYLCVSTNPPYTYALDEFARGMRDGYDALHDLKLHLQTERVLYTPGDGEEKLEKVQKILDSWTSYDGIIVSGCTDAPEIHLLNRYAEQGIPVVLLQNNEPNIQKLFVSCLDATVSSMMAAEFIGACLRRAESKNVVLFTGDRKYWLHSEADGIFRKYERRFGFRLAGSYDMKDSSALLEEQVVELYEKQRIHPDAIFITSGVSHALCEYIKANRLREEVLLVTFDMSPRISRYLRDGIVTATIYQDLYAQAKNAFTGLVEYLVDHRSLDTIYTPAPALVMRSNMEYYMK